MFAFENRKCFKTKMFEMQMNMFFLIKNISFEDENFDEKKKKKM